MTKNPPTNTVAAGRAFERFADELAAAKELVSEIGQRLDKLSMADTVAAAAFGRELGEVLERAIAASDDYHRAAGLVEKCPSCGEPWLPQAHRRVEPLTGLEVDPDICPECQSDLDAEAEAAEFAGRLAELDIPVSAVIPADALSGGCA